jgi:hypothetical protein
MARKTKAKKQGSTQRRREEVERAQSTNRVGEREVSSNIATPLEAKTLLYLKKDLRRTLYLSIALLIFIATLKISEKTWLSDLQNIF